MSPVALEPVDELAVQLLDAACEAEEPVLVDERLILRHFVLHKLGLSLLTFPPPLVFLFRALQGLLPPLDVFCDEPFGRLRVHEEIEAEGQRVHDT